MKKPNGSLRICLDPTDLNKEIVRPVCNSQTMDDIIEKLKSARYFAVFDTSKGFFHVPLDQESKMLTAMLTPFGICSTCSEKGDQLQNHDISFIF